MRKALYGFLLAATFFFFCLSGLPAQTGSSGQTSSHFDMTGAPQWVKDLRRAEIIAFGSFPIMYLVSSYGVEFTVNSYGQAQRFRSIGIAAGGSVLLALADYSIVLAKRKRQERSARSLPPGTPIIIRTPLDGDEPEKTLPETESGESSSKAEYR